MTLENMKEFIVLAETRNYQYAAERLFTTQATLSRHIMSIEEELGLVLFDRSHKRVELTDVGFQFLSYAQQALTIQEKYTTDIMRKLHEVNGHLTIGSHSSSSYYNIPDLLGSFVKEYPNIQISIIEEEDDALREMVRVGKCDFAFVRETHINHHALSSITVNFDTLVVAMSTRHRLSSRSSVTLNELRDEEFMLPPRNSPMYQTYMNIFQKQDIAPKHSKIAGTSGRNIFQFVGQGLCLALYWKKTAKAIRPPDTVLTDIDPAVYMYVNMLYRDDYTSTARDNFLQFVRLRVEQQSWINERRVPGEV